MAAGSRASNRYSNIGHTYTPDKRAEMLGWFARWQKPDKGK